MPSEQLSPNIKAAARVAEALHVETAEILKWAEAVGLREVGPGVSVVPAGEPLLLDYLRTRRVEAFVDAYFALPSQKLSTVWMYHHNSEDADPKKGQHSSTTLDDPSVELAFTIGKGDVVYVQLGSFVGREGELEHAVARIVETQAIIFMCQSGLVNPVLFPSDWFGQRFGYIPVVEDANLFAPGAQVG